MFDSRWLTRITQICLRFPRATIIFSLALALGCVGVTLARLQFHTSRQDLLNPRSEFHQRWLAFQEQFGSESDVVIVIEGPGPDAIKAAIDDVGEALRRQPELFHDTLDRFGAEALVAKGMFYLPDEVLNSLEAYVVAATNCLRQPRVRLDDLTGMLAAAHANDQTQASTSQTPSTQRGTDSRYWRARIREQFPDYLLSPQGTIGLVLTRVKPTSNGFVPDDTPFSALEAIRQSVQTTHDTVKVGLTGLPVLEHAEMQTSQQDMTWASLLSVLAVATLMWSGFGGFKYPLLGMASLLVGIAWTCGYVTLIVGHLNILSMSFGVILIGLGIDFAVHWLARYLDIRRAESDLDETLLQTSRQAGPPIVAGGVTTAAAFFATSVTEFRGVAELGLIAGGGILLCVAATLLLLPCLVRFTDHALLEIRPVRLLTLESGLRFFWRFPIRTAVTFAACTCFLATGLGQLRYDPNLLNLQADHLPSVQWERKLLSESDRNSWFAVSMADSWQELRERKRAFAQLESVAYVEDLAPLLPTNSPSRQAQIDRIDALLSHVRDAPPVLEPVAVLDADGGQPRLGSHRERTPDGPMPSAADGKSRWLKWNADRTLAAENLWQSLKDLQSISQRHAPQLEDIPAEIRHRFIGRSGKLLMRVYPRENIWQINPLQRFVTQLEQVDPQITGDPVQTYYASRQMKSSYVQAAGWASLAVLLILIFDLRRATDVLLAALPTALGLIQLFGLMGLLQLPLNPANIIVLPLVIGIGIDDGIHVMHDHRRRRAAGQLSRSTVTGIVLTSLTSMIGFGSLMLARHEGLRSLGRVVTLGIACCLLTSLVLLPCLLRGLDARSRRRGTSARPSPSR